MKTTKKAVALRYPDTADAPYIAANEKGSRAERLIGIAQAAGVPVVEDTVLTDILSVNSIGSFIPEETYTALAKIFVCIRQMESEDHNDRI
jgi:flagellar biosynthesis protein